jgi:phytoene dehydrogenase-like protein
MKEKYDVIIVGSGIGGLVCGCFLSKKGVRVLIVERNATPGGYCNSFNAKGYEFDGCVHSLGNVSKGSKLYNILESLGVIDEIVFEKHDPSDAIVTPDFKVNFWNNVDQTIQDLQNIFPRDAKGIDYFFHEIICRKSDIELLRTYRQMLYKDLLDLYFSDNRLKAILSLIILGDMGVPHQHVSAYSAVEHYKQFILNGGFYPRDGIQTLPNSLARKIQEYGGEFIYSNGVEKIELNAIGCASRVVLKKGQVFSSKYIVSDCDARQTFLGMVGRENINDKFAIHLENLKPSLSVFILYLGLKEPISSSMVKDGVNTWFLSNYNYNEFHADKINYSFDINKIRGFLVCPNFKKKRLMVLTSAPFETPEFWEINRGRIMDMLISEVSLKLPEINNNIELKIATTPQGLFKWTLNYSGAAYGWANIPGQVMHPYYYGRDKIVKNLYLCGHWSTFGSGIPSVALMGEKTAQLILNKIGGVS